MFAIGSVTKQFTCSALMMLAEEKKLSLTDPVSKYFPKLTRAKDITLVDLGGHLSGYRDYYPLDFVDNEMQKPATADAIIDEYATRPLDFEPRSRYSYSNTGFIILGRVIEKVSGQPFGDVHHEAPLHAARPDAHGVRAGVERDERHGEGLFVVRTRAADSRGARSEGLGWRRRRDLVDADRSAELGSCARRSQADLGAVVRDDDDGASSDGRPQQRLRLRRGRERSRQAITLSHGGAVSGFIAQNTVIPATKSAVVMLANTDFAAVGALNQELVGEADAAGRHSGRARRRRRSMPRDAFLSGLEKGTVDRSALGRRLQRLSHPGQSVAAARQALNALGRDQEHSRRRHGERGGSEVTTILFDAGTTPARAVMFRTPSGKIEQFLLSRN